MFCAPGIRCGLAVISRKPEEVYAKHSSEGLPTWLSYYTYIYYKRQAFDTCSGNGANHGNWVFSENSRQRIFISLEEGAHKEILGNTWPKSPGFPWEYAGPDIPFQY